MNIKIGYHTILNKNVISGSETKNTTEQRSEKYLFFLSLYSFAYQMLSLDTQFIWLTDLH